MSRQVQTPFCSVCFKAGRPDFNTHYVRAVAADPNSKVTCPYILGSVCKYCRETGHWISRCPILAKKGTQSGGGRTPDYKDVFAAPVVNRGVKTDSRPSEGPALRWAKQVQTLYEVYCEDHETMTPPITPPGSPSLSSLPSLPSLSCSTTFLPCSPPGSPPLQSVKKGVPLKKALVTRQNARPSNQSDHVEGLMKVGGGFAALVMESDEEEEEEGEEPPGPTIIPTRQNACSWADSDSDDE